MEKIMAFFRRKVAGIPVGIIALIVTAAALFAAIKMKKNPEERIDTDGDGIADATAIDTDGDGAVDTVEETGAPVSSLPQSGGSGGWTGGGTTAGIGDDYENPTFDIPGTPVVTPAPPPNIPTPDTNELWGRRVVEWLISQNKSVDESTRMVSKYLEGKQLTVEEDKLRTLAIQKFGLPPEGVDYAPISPTPPTVTPATPSPPASVQGKPPLHHKVKGTNDNNASELARIYYGTNSADAVNKLRAANNTKVEPWGVGQVIYVPANIEPKYFTATASTRTQYDIAKKNDTTASKVESLNPGKKFPVTIGVKVRVA